jgi:glycosyltransferase involved in cell wall biosynthesis
MKVSVAIPAFNEELALLVSLPIILKTLIEAKARQLCDSFEIIVIDDGSSDGTATCVREFRIEMESKRLNSDSSIRLISMLGNQGHMKALDAGYQEFLGDCIITLDADMQDPPEVMIEMIEIFRNTKSGCVQAVRKSRVSDTFFKRFTATLFYRLINFGYSQEKRRK